MTDLSISLNNIRNTRTLYIEDLGVAFTVRKLGAGEELDLSTRMRRLMAIAQEVDKYKLQDIDDSTPEGVAEISKYTDKVAKYTDEINEIKKFELETYKKCFSDNNDGKDVDFLVNALSDEERTKLFKDIFDTPKIVSDIKPTEIK